MKISERCVIRDRNGNVIQRSGNLRGIREYAGKHLVSKVSITRIRDGRGELFILFDNGDNYETEFACFNVLKWSIRNWRNLYGAPLFVNGADCGKVEYGNENLKES